MKRVLRALLSLVIIGGIGFALWPLGQIAYARWNQNTLRAEWQKAAQGAGSKSAHSPSRTATTPAHTATTPVRTATLTQTRKTAKKTSAKPAIAELPPTRIIIPEIGLDAVVVQGFDEESLRRGPGHEPYSALPGQPGNCVIAAHRNVYGSWFYKVDQLWPGSIVTLRTPDESFDYQIVSVHATNDSDISVLRPPPAGEPPRLTLLTCTVPRSTSRIVVVAQLVPPETY
ncbi:MAG TPA: class E sortase [Abditibacteriaceae bacterium]|jgi:sortase A